MSVITIKEAYPESFDEIWPIFHEVAMSGDTYPYPPNISKEDAKKLWFANDAHVYIAYLNNVPIASRYIVPNKVGLGSHVANTGVMIHKDYRSQGIGKLMMEFGLKQAKELGFKAVQLNLVVCTNIASIKICQKYGFEIIGTLPKAFFYKEKEYVDAFVMYKTLS